MRRCAGACRSSWCLRKIMNSCSKGCFFTRVVLNEEILLKRFGIFSKLPLFFTLFHNKKNYSGILLANRANLLSKGNHKSMVRARLLWWIMRFLRDDVRIVLKTLMLLFSRLSKKTRMSSSTITRDKRSSAHPLYGSLCGTTKSNLYKN